MQHPLQASPLEMQPTSGFKESLVGSRHRDRSPRRARYYVCSPRHDSHELAALEL